jgi:hypothetical protein
VRATVAFCATDFKKLLASLPGMLDQFITLRGPQLRRVYTNSGRSHCHFGWPSKNAHIPYSTDLI